jgi:hypothetical protein
MADAQDLKSWDLKQSCRFESDHRHHKNCASSNSFLMLEVLTDTKTDTGFATPSLFVLAAANWPLHVNTKDSVPFKFVFAVKT